MTDTTAGSGTSTVTAHFDTSDKTQRAVTRLRSAGIVYSPIRVTES